MLFRLWDSRKVDEGRWPPAQNAPNSFNFQPYNALAYPIIISVGTRPSDDWRPTQRTPGPGADAFEARL